MLLFDCDVHDGSGRRVLRGLIADRHVCFWFVRRLDRFLVNVDRFDVVGALDGRREGSDVLAGGNRHDGIRVLDHDQTGYQREGRRSGFDGRNGDVTVVFAAFDRVAGIAGSRKDTCGTIPEYARDRSAVDPAAVSSVFGLLRLPVLVQFSIRPLFIFSAIPTRPPV